MTLELTRKKAIRILLLYIASIIFLPFFYMLFQNKKELNEVELTNIMIFINIVIIATSLKYFIVNFKLLMSKNIIMYILISTVLVIALSSILSNIAYNLNNNKITQNEQLLFELFKSMPLIQIMLVLTAPFVEELVFRGAIFSLLGKKFEYFALAISSLIFAGLHLSNNLIDFLVYLLPGLLLGIIYVHSKKYFKNQYNNQYIIVIPTMVHFINNFISVIIYYFN